jgi:hypothetical protein
MDKVKEGHGGLLWASISFIHHSVASSAISMTQTVLLVGSGFGG